MHVPRVERLQLDGRTVWHKRYSAQGRRLPKLLLNWFARRIGSAALLAIMPLAAEAACATERSMIERLRALGVRVPDVVQVDARELVLSDIGLTLAAICRSTLSTDAREALLGKGFAALSDLHARGGYLAQAFARNRARRRHRFHRPGRGPRHDHAGRRGAGARHAVFRLFDARFLADDGARYQRLLVAHLAAEPPEACAELARTVRGLAWLARYVAPFGRHANALTLSLGQLLQAVGPADPYVDVRVA